MLNDVLNDESVTRVFRGNLLLDNCPHQLLMQSIIEENLGFILLINETENMYSCLLRKEIIVAAVVTSDATSKISEALHKKKTAVLNKKRVSCG